jgi:hypothetical protein
VNSVQKQNKPKFLRDGMKPGFISAWFASAAVRDDEGAVFTQSEGNNHKIKKPMYIENRIQTYFRGSDQKPSFHPQESSLRKSLSSQSAVSETTVILENVSAEYPNPEEGLHGQNSKE